MCNMFHKDLFIGYLLLILFNSIISSMLYSFGFRCIPWFVRHHPALSPETFLLLLSTGLHFVIFLINLWIWVLLTLPYDQKPLYVYISCLQSRFYFFVPSPNTFSNILPLPSLFLFYTPFCQHLFCDFAFYKIFIRRIWFTQKY